MTGNTLTRQELDAMHQLAISRRALLFQTFNGTRLTFGKRKYVGKNAGGTAAAIYDLVGMVKEKAPEAAGPKIQEAAEKLMAQVAEVDNFNELVAALGTEAAVELRNEIIPIFGLLYTAKKWSEISLQMTRDAVNLYQIKTRDFRSGFRSGTPEAAVDSVQQIIKGELQIGALDFANQSVGFGTKFAGFFIDMGLATNVGSGVATFVFDFILKLVVIGMDIKKLRAGNRWLQTPADLDIQVFKDCPILGCYLLCSTNTSDIANFFIADIGLPGWMTRIEALNDSKIGPTVTIARELIERSNLQLEGLTATTQPAKTHVKKDFFLRMKVKAASAVSMRLGGSSPKGIGYTAP